MLNKLIDIQCSTRIDEREFSGICLLHNDDVLMFLNFNEETAQFDGFTLLRNEDFESYAEWEGEDFEDLKNDNSKELIGTINPDDYKTFELAIEKLKSTVVAVFDDEELDSYYVGKVEGLKDNQLSLKLISEEAEWMDSKSFDFDSIWYIGFDSEYEKQLMNDAQ